MKNGWSQCYHYANRRVEFPVTSKNLTGWNKGGSQQLFWPWSVSFQIKISHRRQTMISLITIFSTFDQRLVFHWFPSNSSHHSNGNEQPLVSNNVNYLEIQSDTL